MTVRAPLPPAAGRLDEKQYLDRMVPWLSALPQFLRRSVHHPELRYYGTGESLSWPTQSNLNVFAALAIMATSPVLPETSIPLSRQEILETALALLRYALATHLTGHPPATADHGAITGSAFWASNAWRTAWMPFATT